MKEPGLTTIRVLIVEDHPAVRQGLRLVLEQEGIQVCGEADTLETSVAAAARCQPDLVMLDLNLGEEDGLAVARRLSKAAPDLPLLVYTMYEDPVHVDGAFRAGVRGYVTKRETSEVLVHGMRECLAGRRFISPRVGQGAPVPEFPSAGAEALSLQEQQVFDLLGEGLGRSPIAARMDLSPRTVDSYFARIQTKLGLASMRELRQLASRRRY